MKSPYTESKTPKKKLYNSLEVASLTNENLGKTGQKTCFSGKGYKPLSYEAFQIYYRVMV